MTDTYLLWQNTSLSRQKYACHDKSFVAKKKKLSQQNILVTRKLLSQQQQKILTTSILLSWQTHVCHDKTHLLAWQKYVCQDKSFVSTNTCTFVTTKDMLCHDKHTFVTRNMCLSRQIFCRDNNNTCGSCCQRYSVTCDWRTLGTTTEIQGGSCWLRQIQTWIEQFICFHEQNYYGQNYVSDTGKKGCCLLECDKNNKFTKIWNKTDC